MSVSSAEDKLGNAWKLLLFTERQEVVLFSIGKHQLQKTGFANKSLEILRNPTDTGQRSGAVAE